MAEVAWSTIPALVQDAAERFPHTEAMVDGPIRWTFPQLRDEVNRAARALMASGVQAGDRVGVWAPNTWEWAVAALGAHTVGGVVKYAG